MADKRTRDTASDDPAADWTWQDADLSKATHLILGGNIEVKISDDGTTVSTDGEVIELKT